jgi:site-specific DNA-methyltransferase (cytosine-N4-specific)
MKASRAKQPALPGTNDNLDLVRGEGSDEARSRIIVGDALSVLCTLPDNSARCCTTSPPYWSLRDYDIAPQIGAEAHLSEYIESLCRVFEEVRRVLKPDGSLWVNIGDSYTSGGRTWRAPDKKNGARAMRYRPPTPAGLKPKDLIGVPFRLAFALQARGWYLRSDLVWYKPNCQPESVRDRPTQAHEYIFLLTKSPNYYYDYEAIREPREEGTGLRNKRSVWSVNTVPSLLPHYAAFPPDLIEPCILAGSARGDVVLDPFFGTGTVGCVARKHDRRFIGIELKQEYAELAAARLGWSSSRLEAHHDPEKP